MNMRKRMTMGVRTRLGLHQTGAVIPKLALLLIAVMLVFSSGLVACTGEEEEEEEGLPTFVAHFLGPEGEPYPFDRVIVSNGTYRKEFTNLAYIETEVPERATYTFSYRLGNWESYRNFDMSFEAGEVREFEFYAVNLSDLEPRVRPYLLSQEVGCNASLSYTWNPDAARLDWTVSGQTGKYVSIGVVFGTADLLPGDSYWAIPYDPHQPVYCDEYDVHKSALAPPDGGGEPICHTRWVHYYKDMVYSEITGYYTFSTIEPDLVPVRIGYGLYNDSIAVYPIDTTLASLDGASAELIREFFDPQYAVPQGSYLLSTGNIPAGYASSEYPINVGAKGISISNLYLPKISELSDFTFLVAAESAFSQSSYCNLVHDEDNRTLSVDVSTETVYDWWGYFVLPKTATVDRISASYGMLGRTLNEQQDYTVNPVGDYNIFCVRITPDTVSLSAKYRGGTM